MAKIASVKFDATNQSMGRLASSVARSLRGKHLPTFTPNKLPGVHVYVSNIALLRLSPKQRQRPVHRFSGYPGGLKTVRFGDAFAKNADATFRRTVRRMLADNRLRDRMLKFLHIS